MNKLVLENQEKFRGDPRSRWQPRDFCLYCAWRAHDAAPKDVPIISRAIFRAVQWAARKGLREEGTDLAGKENQAAKRAGVRGETYAYWYLRRLGYIFVARNYMPRGIKGEIDMIGYDGKTLAFVEVRTRTVRENLRALPEMSITPGKEHVVVRTAHRFLAERHIGECPCRFDVVAIDNQPGRAPVVRLHKAAFSPR